MGDEEPGNNTSGPRRSTYVPPIDDSLADEDVIAEVAAQGAPPAPSAAALPQPSADNSLVYPPAPVRRSLPPSAVFAEGDASDIAAMMDRLELQLVLKREEEEAFHDWSEQIRQSHPELAEAIIVHERAIFDGGQRQEFRIEPLAEETAEVEAEAPSEPEKPAVIAQEDIAEVLADEQESSSIPTEGDPKAGADDTPVVPAAARKPVRVPGVLSPTRWSLVSTWMIAVLPAGALTLGVWLVGGGADFSQAITATAIAAVILGLVIAGLTRARTPLRDTFGTAGSSVPGALVLVLRLSVLAVLVWWSSSLAANIAALSGWWPGSLEEAQIVAAVLMGGSAAAHLFVSAPVLRVTLWASATLGVLGAVALVVRTASKISVLPVWEVPGEAVAVLSVSALIVAVGVALFAPIAPNLAGLVAFRRVRAQGLWAALAATVPMAALVTFVVVLATSAPRFAQAFLEDPIRTLVVGLGTWFPVPALIALVLPFVGLLAVGLSSAASSLRDMSLPGPTTLIASIVTVLFGAAVLASFLWSDALREALPDLVTTLGVAIAAWAGVTAMNAMVPQRPSGHGTPAVRWGNLIGLAVAVALGLGVTSSSVSWLSWQGFLVDFVTVEGLGGLTQGSMGVLLALAAGALAALLSFVFSLARKGTPRVEA